MATTPRPKKPKKPTKREIADRIKRLVREATNRKQMRLLDTPKVQTLAERSVAEGKDDATVLAELNDLMEKLRTDKPAPPTG